MTRPTLIVALACAAVVPSVARSQKPAAAKSENQAAAPASPAPKADPFALATKGLKRTPADTSAPVLFATHSSDERLLGALPGKLFAQKVLMIGTLSSGLGQGRLLGGLPIGLSVLRFERRGKKVFVHEEGTRFTAQPGSPTHAAFAQGYPKTILAVLPIVAPAPGGAVLVDLTSWLLRDPWMLSRVVSADLKGAFRHDPGRSRIEYVKTFPSNVELRYQAAYTGLSQSMPDTILDPRFTTLSLHTSFHELPKTGYRPRKADDRIGYFLTARRDFSKQRNRSTYDRFLHRWHLEKADPKAKLSPPKEPIVFYMEKTIPHEWRPYVRRGILAWNRAFEAAGFVDAIEVRQQLAGDDWDPEDAKYNSVRWITSHEASFGAIGPSRVNPYTGQILDADVLIEASMMREYWLEYQRALPEYDGVAQVPAQEPLPALHWLQDPQHAGCACRLAHGRRQDLTIARLLPRLLEGTSASAADSASTPAERKVPTEFLGAALQETVMHEIGHTLGLKHNFKASRWRSGADLHDAEATRREGLVGSVMDYNAINIAPDGQKQGEYFASRVGPYDVWAIRYGYTPFAPPAEEKGLAAIAAESAKEGHDYGSDEDALTWTGGMDAVDPYCAVWDMGGDAFAFVDRRYELAKELLPKLTERNVAKGEGHQLERYALTILVWQALQGHDYLARMVGGAQIRRDHKGDPDARTPVDPISAEDQRRALKHVCERAFSDDLLRSIPAEQLRRLHPSRWWHWGVSLPTRVDFSLANLGMAAQTAVLNRLLHPKTLARVQENELRAPEGTEAMTLPELYETLHASVFAELIQGSSTSVFRRALQRVLAQHWIRQATGEVPGLPADAKALALLRLSEFETFVLPADRDAYTRAHVLDLKRRAARAREASLQLDR